MYPFSQVAGCEHYVSRLTSTTRTFIWGSRRGTPYPASRPKNKPYPASRQKNKPYPASRQKINLIPPKSINGGGGICISEMARNGLKLSTMVGDNFEICIYEMARNG